MDHRNLVALTIPDSNAVARALTLAAAGHQLKAQEYAAAIRFADCDAALESARQFLALASRFRCVDE